MSIEEYLSDTYHGKLRYRNIPRVKTYPKRETYLKIELFVVIEKQRMMGTPEKTSVIVHRASAKTDDERQAALHTMHRVDLSQDLLSHDL